MNELFFAIPGDLGTQSGGYSYDRRLIHELGLLGWFVAHIELGASYPNPSNAHASHAVAALSGLPASAIVIIDGLALGAMDTNLVARLKAQLVALVHHPLALEGDLNPDKKNFLFETERANLHYAKRVIVPSSYTAQLLVSDFALPAECITVARPGIDQVAKVMSPLDPPLILSVGIQLPRKGHDVFLRALATIKQLHWQAVVAGPALDADYSLALTNLTQELGLENRVRFLGQVSDAELSNLYRSASVFALATRFEGYGMVFGEAMVYGLPIVSCDVGAVSETVPQEAARLVEADNPEAFGSALAELIENRELRKKLARSSLKAGVNLNGWADTAALVDEMLKELTEGK